MGPIYLQGNRHCYYIWVCKDAFDGAVCLCLDANPDEGANVDRSPLANQ